MGLIIMQIININIKSLMNLWITKKQVIHEIHRLNKLKDFIFLKDIRIMASQKSSRNRVDKMAKKVRPTL